MKVLIAAILALTAGVFHPDERYKPGDIALPFSLQNVTNGEMVDLASMSDTKGFIVIFTANSCPYAKAYEGRIVELHEDFAHKGYPVIAINSNDPERAPDDNISSMKARNFPFPYLKDADQSLAHRFGAVKTPDVFLLHKENNKLVVRYTGGIDDSPLDADEVETNYVEEAIEALEEGDLPNPATTEAIGCTIKWKR